MALLETLRALPQTEREEFRLFLRSPFFTASVRNHKPENLLALLDYLFENQSVDDETFDKAAAYALLFPDKKFSESTINALASELHRLLKDFLKTKTVAASETASTLALAQAYRQRGLEKDFLKTLETLRRDLDEMPPSQRDVEYFLSRYQLDYEWLSYKSERNTKSDDIHLSETIASLDTFFAFAKLRYSVHLLHQRHMVALDAGEVLPLRQILTLTEASPTLTELPAMRCFQQAIETLQAPDEETMTAQFADFQLFLKKFENDIPPERLNRLLAIERSICSRLYVAGRLEMLPKLFDLYREHLAAGHLYQSGGLPPAVFQNIVRAGLKLGEVDWVEHFLAEHPPARIVFSQFPEDVHRLNLASFYFQKKDYPRTLQCLQQRYEDNYYVLDANLLELKLYYERKNWNLLDGKLNAFKVNLFKKSKQWLPAARFTAINRFIDLMRQLTHDRILIEKNSVAIEKLRKKVLENVVAEREWLLEKLDEL